MVHVSWTNAVSYCSFVDRRLPTEAEWEKVATWVPQKGEKLIYPWGNEYDCSKGNFDDETELDASLMQDGSVSCDGYSLTAPIGSFPAGASPYGALDMGGNVWEWVADCWTAGGYDGPAPDPAGDDPACAERRARGGSWDDYPVDLRSARRTSGLSPTLRRNDTGFRVARTQ